MVLFEKIMNKFMDVVRYIKYGKYLKKYGFDKWHMIPKSRKPYVKDIINFIEMDGIDENTCIVECGCGLCDILQNKRFKKCKKIGIERDKKVYDTICELYRGGVFVNGSFDRIRGMDIDWLIAVNFTHEISDDEMSIYLKQLAENNRIKNIILDEVTGNYKYEHHYAELIPKGYSQKHIMGPYPSDGGKRYICIWGIHVSQ